MPIGFANPVIYARYGTSALRDITEPQTSIAIVDQERAPRHRRPHHWARHPGQRTSLSATPGHDDTTGVGTPSARYLDSYR